ncbi:hypothetical protein ACIQYG_21890 [Peribacillus sp. NPDC096622]|uniref:hypothetical protein n=1 Tax=Peribacillus sp. NPDC096622 TaxID=3364396 RepID=UPI00380374F5
MNEVDKAKKLKVNLNVRRRFYDFIDLSFDLKEESLFFELTAALKNFKKGKSKG